VLERDLGTMVSSSFFCFLVCFLLLAKVGSFDPPFTPHHDVLLIMDTKAMGPTKHELKSLKLRAKIHLSSL
jgi:hypothetical protein